MNFNCDVGRINKSESRLFDTPALLYTCSNRAAFSHLYFQYPDRNFVDNFHILLFPGLLRLLRLMLVGEVEHTQLINLGKDDNIKFGNIEQRNR